MKTIFGIFNAPKAILFAQNVIMFAQKHFLHEQNVIMFAQKHFLREQKLFLRHLKDNETSYE